MMDAQLLQWWGLGIVDFSCIDNSMGPSRDWIWKFAIKKQSHPGNAKKNLNKIKGSKLGPSPLHKIDLGMRTCPALSCICPFPSRDRSRHCIL